MKTVTAKLAGMRKAQNFVVYPRKDDRALVVVQSDRAIGQFDPHTGVGVLNWRGSGGKYFMHLNRIMGAEPYEFPATFVGQCLASEPLPGEEIGPGVFVGEVR